jgi:predicted RNA binding protein YcfA (HicA-like mRNA interferase family)
LTGKEVARIAEKAGFVYSHTTGSHMVYKHEDGKRITIPHHAGEEIGPGLLNRIIKRDMGLSREEFLQLL